MHSANILEFILSFAELFRNLANPFKGNAIKRFFGCSRCHISRFAFDELISINEVFNGGVAIKEVSVGSSRVMTGVSC
jgi:hypothetical protein